jgi:hypothetical protein
LPVTPDDMGRGPVEGIFIAADDYEIVLRLSRGNLSNWLIDILIKYSGPRVIYYADSEYHHDISP